MSDILYHLIGSGSMGLLGYSLTSTTYGVFIKKVFPYFIPTWVKHLSLFISVIVGIIFSYVAHMLQDYLFVCYGLKCLIGAN